MESKEAKEALKRHDKRLGEIVRALEETGEMESTTVVLLGDHYQKDVDKVAFVNHALWKAGLLTVRNGRIKSWKAYAKNCDGSCYISVSYTHLDVYKRQVLPWESVIRPSSSTCSKTLKTSGCAFSISSNRTTE